MALGRTVGELEASLSAAELREWIAFYNIDPWGEQRADLRMARIAWAVLQANSRQPISEDALRLFPDEAHSLPDDVSAEERQWMLALNRSGE